MARLPFDPNRIHLSEHYRDRCAERRIPVDAAFVVARNGTPEPLYPWCGTFTIALQPLDAAWASGHLSDIDQYIGVTVLFSREAVAVTVYRGVESREVGDV